MNILQIKVHKRKLLPDQTVAFVRISSILKYFLLIIYPKKVTRENNWRVDGIDLVIFKEINN